MKRPSNDHDEFPDSHHDDAVDPVPAMAELLRKHAMNHDIFAQMKKKKEEALGKVLGKIIEFLLIYIGGFYAWNYLAHQFDWRVLPFWTYVVVRFTITSFAQAWHK